MHAPVQISSSVQLFDRASDRAGAWLVARRPHFAGRQSCRSDENMPHRPALALFVSVALVTTLAFAEPNDHRDDAQLMKTGFKKKVEASVRMLTEADCVDSDDGYYGYDCATILAVGYCSTYMCPTCGGAGLCDVSCGYCATTAPTAAPIAAPSVAVEDCVDSDDGYYGYDCATILAVGYCPTHMCPTRSGAGLCDVSCGYCSTTAPTTLPTPSPSLTDCVDSEEGYYGYYCATILAVGYCPTYMCPTCSGAGLCDVSCGYCSTTAPTTLPSRSPSLADCVDSEDGYYGYDCATILAVGYCPTYMCPTCSGAGLCDVSCGYCPSPAPTVAPVADCVDSEDGYCGYDCATVLAVGYCPTYMCPTCSGAGLCDASCGYCSTSSVVSTASPSTASPTSSHAPTTLGGAYYVSTFSGMVDAISDAEDDSECVVYLREDVSADSSIEITSGKSVKMVGSHASGRRIRVTPASRRRLEDETFWTSTSRGLLWAEPAAASTALWLENIEISGFHETTANVYVIELEAPNPTVTLVNCRIANNKNPLMLFPYGHLIVNSSEFSDNFANDQGAAIRALDGTTLTITSTIFARNVVQNLNAGAIVAFQGSTTTISNCSFLENYALKGAAVESSDNRFNSSVLLQQGSLIIQDSFFQNNTSGAGGGAVVNGAKFKLRISNTAFTDNLALGGDGGALMIDPDCSATIAHSVFERNRAPSGEGGAVIVSGSKLYVIGSNFTANMAFDGGAVRSTGGAVLHARGETRFDNNIALRSGGAISLDASSLKTNEAALVFVENSARLGGALSVENDAHAVMQAGCQTTTFEMHWASSETLIYAEDTHSVVVRRIAKNTNETLSMPDVVDERGEITMLYPSGAEDENVSFCLAPGDFEIVASEGEIWPLTLIIVATD